MKANQIAFAKRVYRLADSRGHSFDANVYLSMRADGWVAEAALYYARRAYSGRRQAWRRGALLSAA